jgi:hypothetical protein
VGRHVSVTRIGAVRHILMLIRNARHVPVAVPSLGWLGAVLLLLPKLGGGFFVLDLEALLCLPGGLAVALLGTLVSLVPLRGLTQVLLV